MDCTQPYRRPTPLFFHKNIHAQVVRRLGKLCRKGTQQAALRACAMCTIMPPAPFHKTTSGRQSKSSCVKCRESKSKERHSYNKL